MPVWNPWESLCCVTFRMFKSKVLRTLLNQEAEYALHRLCQCDHTKARTRVWWWFTLRVLAGAPTPTRHTTAWHIQKKYCPGRGPRPRAVLPRLLQGKAAHLIFKILRFFLGFFLYYDYYYYLEILNFMMQFHRAWDCPTCSPNSHIPTDFTHFVTIV